MSLLFGRSCQYAIQATILLALQPKDKLLLISDIARKMDIPPPYLAKVLQVLAKRGLLISVKGPGGGFKLGASPEDIVLKDIVECTEGLVAFDQCIMGFQKCGGDNLCPVHETWLGIKENILENLLSKSIAELLEMLRKRPHPSLAQALYF